MSQVVFFGLLQLFPLIHLDVLKIPTLCTKYMELVADVVEFHQDQLLQLPDTLFSTLVQSLEFGIDHAVYDVTRWALQAIGALAQFCFSLQRKGDVQRAQQLFNSLDGFFCLLMNVMLFKEFNTDLMDLACETWYWLLVARQVTFIALAKEIIAQQTDIQVAQQLMAAFDALGMPQEPQGNEHVLSLVNRQPQAHFKEKLRAFLGTTRGSLHIK
jgi:hypothetical protein